MIVNLGKGERVEVYKTDQMSGFPHKVFIHAPGDIGQGLFHHEPHKGYNANVEYIRSDIAQQREAELVEAAYREGHAMGRCGNEDADWRNSDARALLAKAERT